MHRTYLYAPGDRPERMSNATGLGVDAVILDLEDGVAPRSKELARIEVARFLKAAGATSSATSSALLVRVNSTDLRADVEALRSVLGLVDAIYLAKATTARLDELDALLGSAGTPVVGLIESARGLLDAPMIAAHPRVRTLAIGEADLTAELAIRPSADDRELLSLRAQVVVASAAAGIDPPTGPVSTEFRDLGAFRVSTEALARQGFGARSCIHPDQVAVVAAVFTPSETELEAARALVTSFDDALTRGEGVLVGPDGRMVDEAVVRHARRLLAD